MKNIFYSILFLASLLTVKSYAQDAHFSQFYANPIYLNPTLAGNAGKYRAVAAHRQQGTKNEGFTTSSFSLDAPLAQSSGWGLQVINDVQMNGVLNTTSYNISLRHSININKESQIGLGLRLGVYQKAFDWDKLTFEDQLDSRNGIVGTTGERFGRNQVSNPDIALGLVYSSKNIFAGTTISHVNRPKENFTIDSESTLPIKITTHVGSIFNLVNTRRQEYVFSPNVIYERQGTLEYLNLGMYFGNETWTVGGWYRVNDAIIASMGLNVADFKIGYSYDLPIAAYKSFNSNAHEITLGYQFEIKHKRKIKNTYKGKCPKFQKYLF